MGNRLFVGNLSFSVSEDELRTLFGQHGEVTTVQIIKDKYTERSRGFGFVEMATEEAAKAAVAALNQYQLAGRPLTVNEARERTERPRREGGGGGRREGGGGGDFNRNRW
jgi:RNA recognition motif-containing protein